MKIRRKHWLIGFGILILLLGSLLWYSLFGHVFDVRKTVKIRIRSGWSLNQLSDSLQVKAKLTQPDLFLYWSKTLGYSSPKPCVIEVDPHESLYGLIKRLKENRNQTVNVAIRGSMDADALGILLASKLEINKDSFLLELKQGKYLRKYNFNDTSWPALFIPNTYNLFAATNLEELIVRMEKEYQKFWNSKRVQRSIVQRLTCKEVITIASIVTKESNKIDEYENIAGVYLNRLRKNMLLQADPTVVFARGKAGRVWAADLAIQNPYNTYIHPGLPPGPICIPNVASIEAVLNYKQHDYLYFCAKPDFSGYHAFARNLQEHNNNAAAFHQALNARNIK
jgi:UPF0755 protein